MEIKVFHIKKSTIALLIGITIGLIAYMCEFIRISQIDKIGVISKILIYNAPNSDIRDYYFLTNDDKKIWIRQNLNSKMKKYQKAIYSNKMIKYDPLNPEDYILTDLNKKPIKPPLLYYFAGIPIIFYAFFMLFFPNKIFYKIYDKVYSSIITERNLKT